MAPEVLTGDEYNIKADIYSFGIIVWEMLARKTPFKDFTERQLFAKVGMGQERPVMPDNVPVKLAQLIAACWDAEADKRPMMDQAIAELEQLCAEYPIEDKQLCEVCLDDNKCMVFVPCGHICCCEGCAAGVNSCPMCRIAIVQKFKIFVS